MRGASVLDNPVTDKGATAAAMNPSSAIAGRIDAVFLSADKRPA